MTFAELLSRFEGRRALVVGDLMLDEYIFGRATRISQEAPVMVVRQTSTRAVPGGAANVAANMMALGARVTMVGVVGDDAAGRTLGEALGGFGVENPCLVKDASRPTTRKTRVLANHAHQVLRIDHEESAPVPDEIEAEVVRGVLDRLAEVDVVLISDYQKGAVTPSGIAQIIEAARERRVPVVANAKPRSLWQYRGAALVSLNRPEATEALGWAEAVSVADAPNAAALLREKAGVDGMLVTLGGDGMAAAGKDSFYVPAVRVEVYDEAGAGDTVIATIALGIAADAFSRELLALATQTAAAVVQKVGVAVPSAEDLAKIRTTQVSSLDTPA